MSVSQECTSSKFVKNASSRVLVSVRFTETGEMIRGHEPDPLGCAVPPFRPTVSKVSGSRTHMSRRAGRFRVDLVRCARACAFSFHAPLVHVGTAGRRAVCCWARGPRCAERAKQKTRPAHQERHGERLEENLRIAGRGGTSSPTTTTNKTDTAVRVFPPGAPLKSPISKLRSQLRLRTRLGREGGRAMTREGREGREGREAHG